MKAIPVYLCSYISSGGFIHWHLVAKKDISACDPSIDSLYPSAWAAKKNLKKYKKNYSSFF